MKPEKKQIINDFKHHVSSGKVAVYKKYRIQFVMGERRGAYMTDVSGNKTLINCHCNGGVFNLGHRNPQIIETLIKATEKYYKEDKFIWQLFRGVRRANRFMNTRILGKRYEFTLPGQIERRGCLLIFNNWSSPVERQVVSSFRTVFHNPGFLISITLQPLKTHVKVFIL